MKTKHTQGEWINTTDGEANFYGVCTQNNWLLRIQQNGELTIEVQEANAKLIAAAPELLEALMEVKEFLGHIQPKVGEAAFDEIWDITEEAIKKATE